MGLINEIKEGCRIGIPLSVPRSDSASDEEGCISKYGELPLRSADLIFIAHPKSRVIINILKLSV